MPRSNTLSASPKPASSFQSEASATAMITLWQKRLMAFTKAEVIHHRGPWRYFEAVEFATLEWVTGSTTGGSSNLLAPSHPPKPNNATTPSWTTFLWPANSSQSTSGSPKAVQNPFCQRGLVCPQNVSCLRAFNYRLASDVCRTYEKETVTLEFV